MMTILLFVLYVAFHALLFALCASAAAGDRDVERFFDEYSRRRDS